MRCCLCRQESHAIPQRCKSKVKTLATFLKYMKTRFTAGLLKKNQYYPFSCKEMRNPRIPTQHRTAFGLQSCFHCLSLPSLHFLFATPLPGRIFCGTQIPHLPVHHFLIEEVQCFIHLFLFKSALR